MVIDRDLALQAQRKLTAPFDPDRGQGTRSNQTRDETIEAGAKAIYGIVTQTNDPREVERKWKSVAKPLTRDRHRAEAEACLRAAT
ncbi:hypothetical protein FPY71_10225 [Aureimonas fodinaquatilis]|uniref:Uncharacterized protein n=1 Tax=Aureimonas fodinaquatilis TaxID=2565783 RepID=A0A5B0DWK3_9HYPH|nr:hypothetical protein [Aureimonas fodinaquatilis]KAA0970843.1 hypothetical protein FPY71_10225 [Aureimonas fodinaquatilis]